MRFHDAAAFRADVRQTSVCREMRRQRAAAFRVLSDRLQFVAKCAAGRTAAPFRPAVRKPSVCREIRRQRAAAFRAAVTFSFVAKYAVSELLRSGPLSDNLQFVAKCAASELLFSVPMPDKLQFVAEMRLATEPFNFFETEAIWARY